MLGTVLAKFGKAFQDDRENDRENDRVQGWSWNIK